jgi:hypothetical protein
VSTPPSEAEQPTYESLPNKSGRFLVTTASGTQYRFDRERFTVTRIPVPGAAPSVNDGVRPLRTVDACTVGKAGRWTMRSDDPGSIDFYWQTTTPIVSIIAAPPSEAP